MRCVGLPLILCSLMAHAAPPAARDVATASATVAKAPWEWADADRLRVRFDPASVQERASPAAMEQFGVRLPRVAPTARGSEAHLEAVPNVIVGRRNPELFMPFELFNYLIAGGFSADAEERKQFRQLLDPLIGTPPIAAAFWSSVEDAATPFIRSQQRERELFAQLNASGTDAARVTARQEIRDLQMLQCSERAAALEAVTQRVGRGALYRALYVGVAPTVNMTSIEPDSFQRLQFAAGGCR